MQYVLGSFANIFLTEDDISEVTKIISLFLATFNQIVKSLIMIIYRDYFLEMKENMDRFVENEMKHSDKNYQLIRKGSTTLNFLTK